MKEPEHYLKCGYEDHGYVSPELSSSEIYPDYIREEVMETVRSVQSHQKHDTVTFGFMTDLHYAMSYNHEIRMQRNINAYKEICKRAQVNFLALGGDYTNEGCKSYKSDCFRELRAHLDGVDYYPAHGNHDDGTIWDKAYLKIKGQADMLSHDDLFTLFYNHLPQKGIKVKEHTLYYFMDDKNTKMRYIFLDSNDTPDTLDEEGERKYLGQYWFGFSQAQLDWLVNEALAFDEEGWSVVFFSHSILRKPDEKPVGTGKGWENLRILHDILGAYKNGENCVVNFGENELERNINIDFSKRIRAEVIAGFIGDFHTDSVENYRGVQYVLTANSVTYYSGSAAAVPRADGDKTEILFDIVTIDKNERKIYIARMGAGEDRVVEY